MHIPEELQIAIEKEIESFGLNRLLEARQELTERYRTQNSKQHYISNDEQRCAYIAARMPATYAVVYNVLEEVKSRSATTKLNSLLDLGAGPGTAMWAACEVFPTIDKATLLERDAGLIAIGKRLAAANLESPMSSAHWLMSDLEQVSSLPKHDLITLSYSIGELPNQKIPSLIEKCWEAADQFLVVIEPGTPVGFERIRAIRSQLIEMKANILAPCPGGMTCPMSGGDWCHFSERVERTSIHRRLKEGALGHEDEKYSYIAVSKIPVDLPQARVLRHPSKKSGHVNLTLCTPEGLKQVTVSKRTPEAYRQAKKAEWGSPFNF